MKPARRTMAADRAKRSTMSVLSGSVSALGRAKNPASFSCTADGATGRVFDIREHCRPGWLSWTHS